MKEPLVTGFRFNQIYTDQLEPTLAFYEKHFGFKTEFTMKDGSVWGKAGDFGLWIGGGYDRAPQGERQTRTSIMYSVKSSHAFFRQLKADQVETLQAAPLQMDETTYWFQFRDPAGNILECLGNE